MRVVGVTQPRRMPHERTCFAVCRRVQGRRFMLRPDARFTAMVTWLLADCAAAFDVEVHAATFMSTHYHLVVTCGEQRLSDFLERFNGVLARATNAMRRARRGVLWEPGKLGIVELKTVDAVAFQIGYAVVNPVAAGLVWNPEDWPGLRVLPNDIGRRVVHAARPDVFFDPARSWAASASLRTTLPACLLALGADEARRKVHEQVTDQLAEAHRDIRRKRYRVLGPVAARAVSPYRRAKTWEPFGVINPAFATGPGRRLERIAAAIELVQFRRDYREAYARYRDGELDVVFPYGTLQMRRHHHVRVAPPPS